MVSTSPSSTRRAQAVREDRIGDRQGGCRPEKDAVALGERRPEEIANRLEMRSELVRAENAKRPIPVEGAEGAGVVGATGGGHHHEIAVPVRRKDGHRLGVDPLEARAPLGRVRNTPAGRPTKALEQRRSLTEQLEVAGAGPLHGLEQFTRPAHDPPIDGPGLCRREHLETPTRGTEHLPVHRAAEEHAALRESRPPALGVEAEVETVVDLDDRGAIGGASEDPRSGGKGGGHGTRPGAGSFPQRSGGGEACRRTARAHERGTGYSSSRGAPSGS